MSVCSSAMKASEFQPSAGPRLPQVIRVKIADLNDHLKCQLCFGYLVDATTLVECAPAGPKSPIDGLPPTDPPRPHSFCRSCILRYLESSDSCPLCGSVINLSQLHRYLMPDHTLQDLVYKLVPGLYKRELKRRRDFYASFCQQTSAEDGGKGRVQVFDRHLVELAAFICSEDELISLSLEYAPSPNKDDEQDVEQEKKKSTSKSKKRKSDEVKKKMNKLDELKFKRYLRCPAAVTIGHLRKLLHLKLELPNPYMIEILRSDEPLDEELRLLDLAYIYKWHREAPMQLFFHIWKRDTDESMEAMPCLIAEASPPPQPLPVITSPPKEDSSEGPPRKKRKTATPAKRVRNPEPITSASAPAPSAAGIPIAIPRFPSAPLPPTTSCVPSTSASSLDETPRTESILTSLLRAKPSDVPLYESSLALSYPQLPIPTSLALSAPQMTVSPVSKPSSTSSQLQQLLQAPSAATAAGMRPVLPCPPLRTPQMIPAFLTPEGRAVPASCHTHCPPNGIQGYLVFGGERLPQPSLLGPHRFV